MRLDFWCVEKMSSSLSYQTVEMAATNLQGGKSYEFTIRFVRMHVADTYERTIDK